MAQIGQRLRWVREAMDVSQATIAARVGVTQTAWGKYEQGDRTPDQFHAVRIAAKLRISIPYIKEGNLEGVDRDLAIKIAARHPELVFPIRKEPRKDTGQ